MNIPNLNGNWIDLIILLALVYFLAQAWQLGFWVMLGDFLAFLGSLLVALRFYPFLADLVKANFSLSASASNAVGFLLTAVLAEAVLGTIFARLAEKLSKRRLKPVIDRALAFLPATGEVAILTAFFLTFALALPVNPRLKADVADSKIGALLIERTAGLEARLNEIFGGVIEQSLTSLTIKPNSRERVSLTIEAQELEVDEVAEAEMFRLINEERRKAGMAEISWSPEMVVVARAHATDMWERRYFGHFSPEGEDVGDRLARAGIDYTLAGENLALAPTISTAHTGLMNSPGHRANILEAKFGKVGIGVIDNGIYGKMFVQVFTD